MRRAAAAALRRASCQHTGVVMPATGQSSRDWGRRSVLSALHLEAEAGQWWLNGAAARRRIACVRSRPASVPVQIWKRLSSSSTGGGITDHGGVVFPQEHAAGSQHISTVDRSLSNLVPGQDVEVWRGAAAGWGKARVVLVSSDKFLVKFDAPAVADGGVHRIGGVASAEAERSGTAGKVDEHLWLERGSAHARLATAHEHGASGGTKARGRGGMYTGNIPDVNLEVMNYLRQLDHRLRFQGIHVLRWFSGMVLVGAVALYLFYVIFAEDVRSGLGAEGAIVTSRTISDKRVQDAAEVVAKEVALELLRNPATIHGAAEFVKQVGRRP